MSESDKPLRQQIDEGMEAIRQQLERLREGPTMGDPSDDRTLIADLEAECQALEEARGGLDPMIVHPTTSTTKQEISSSWCPRCTSCPQSSARYELRFKEFGGGETTGKGAERQRASLPK